MKIEIEINCYVATVAPDEISARAMLEEHVHDDNLTLVHIDGGEEEDEMQTYVYALCADVVPELDDDIEMLSLHFSITHGQGRCNMLRVPLPDAPLEFDRTRPVSITNPMQSLLTTPDGPTDYVIRAYSDRAADYHVVRCSTNETLFSGRYSLARKFALDTLR